MKIENIVVGYLEENCFILEKDNKILIVDPGDEGEKIIDKINGREILGVLITHNHFDHVGALSYFEDYNIYSSSNLEEKEYNIGPFKFDVIFTPGHSSDSTSYYFEDDNVIFSGDFIFYENIGRCDLPSGDFNSMLESIDKIKKYPSDMVIYPGHGESTILSYEIKNNIYFRMEK